MIRLIFILFFILLACNTNAYPRLCYLPINSTYFVRIDTGQLLTHRSIKCVDIPNEKFEKQVTQLLKKTKPLNATLEEFGDFRVCLQFSNKRNIYILTFGAILYNGKLYKPIKKILRLIEPYVNYKWQRKFYKQAGKIKKSQNYD
jgi:hypothetical protein